ncbi:Reverse transcriptase, RNA-dependent DNA polymerase [Corchorus capsularis]|uniref:Reverse transcriptase, RNA-dependent DNA polymerase n=1 Tax=Corchorus capsularis TaxID=210143 RepID=A0A1R3I3D8_COCAP|nr:Reverse transcriptase, RNA-dependent DNA polymerase [Corchorus capsularis]
MSEKKSESSGSKAVPIVVQSEGVFNVGILLSESNYDVWSQLMEMHIAEREKLSYIREKTEPPAEYLMMGTRSGLDNVYEQIRGQILSKESIPTLEDCYALIRREAVRRETLKIEHGNLEAAVMGIQIGGIIIEHPRKKNSKKTPAATVVETKADDDVVEMNSALAGAIDRGGKNFISAHVSNSTWIIDSGATNHMTFDSRQVIDLKQSSQKFGSIANGDEAPIVGEGSLTLTDSLNLDSVLVVPSLDYNLLSVSQITSGNGVDDQEEHESRIESEEIGDVVPSVTEDKTLIDIPHQSSAEDVPIPAPEPPRKQLPERLTRAIPNSVQEALDDPKWRAAMNEEIWHSGTIQSEIGGKRSPRAWFGRFAKSMIAFGYQQSNSDHTLFIKKGQGKITALIVYVDDMVVTGNDPDERKALQEYFSREFEMKDLGCLKYFLGIEVSRSKKGIFLSQRKYALDLLHETGMSACQPADTPVEEGLKLCVEADQVPVDKGRYQRLVGRLMYLAQTRPDLAYALSIVSQFMHNPSEQHMKGVMRILRYVKSSPGKGILFTKNEDWQGINVYTDADWAGSLDDRRSTSGYFTFVGGNLVTWRSKKQNVVARSSADAEFRGIALGLCEALWLRLLLQDLGYPPRQPIRLYCDNKAAWDIAHNPVQHDRTKHVEVDKFFIKEKLDEGIVDLPKIRSKDQLADILTKAVSGHVFSKFLGKLGMHDIYAPT